MIFSLFTLVLSRNGELLLRYSLLESPRREDVHLRLKVPIWDCNINSIPRSLTDLWWWRNDFLCTSFSLTYLRDSLTSPVLLNSQSCWPGHMSHPRVRQLRMFFLIMHSYSSTQPMDVLRQNSSEISYLTEEAEIMKWKSIRENHCRKKMHAWMCFGVLSVFPTLLNRTNKD